MISRELPERYMAKLLYGWGNRKYNWEYWKQIVEEKSVLKI